MKSFSKRVASFAMAAAMVLSLAVPTDAEAASKYSLTKKTSITSSTTGKYYIKGVSKKQYVKVSVSGKAKSGVTVKTSAGKKLTSSTKLNGTGKTLVLKVSNKGVVGKSYKLTAKVYNSNNKVAKTLTSTTYVKNNNFTVSAKDVSVVEDETTTVTATAKYKYSTGAYTWASADESVATVVNGVITGVTAGTTNVTVSRGNYTKTVKVTVTAGPTKVATATAKNATTVELTGKHLERLTVKDVKVAGYTVVTIKASEDGKTATVALGSALVPNKDATVEVTIGEDKATFTVKYSTEAAALAVKEATYGVSSDAVLTVLVNGVETSLNELKANGYTTTFYSYKEDATGTLKTTNDLFDLHSDFKSTTGKLAGATGYAIPAGTYKVKVVLVKGGTTLTSEYANITITDKKIYEQSISELSVTTSNSIYKLSGDAFSLKVGDVYALTDLKTKTTYGTDTSITQTQLAKVIMKSSDTSVATVSGNKIYAHKSGTTNLTVTYGQLSKTLALTVKTDARNFATVEIPSWSAKEVVIGNTVGTNIYAVDNYGAYMVGQLLYVELPQNDTAVLSRVFEVSGNTVVSNNDIDKCVSTDATGSVKLSYTASSVAGAKATFSVYKGNNSVQKYEGALITTYNVTNVAKNAATYKLEVEKGIQFSADTNIDFNPLSADDKVKIKLNKYYSNVYQSTDTSWATGTVSKNTISYDDSIICVESAKTDTVVTNNSVIKDVTGDIDYLKVYPTGKAGSTTITIKDDTQKVVASIEVTATNTVPNVDDIALAFDKITYDVDTTIDFRNVLQVVPNKDNPEIPGVTLSNNTKNYSVVKLCNTTGSVKGYQKDPSTKRWAPDVAITPGELYIETPEGNLILGKLGYNKTVGGSNGYTVVTDSLTINANQATSINFAMIESTDAASPLTKVMNVLKSSISVNSYK